jgi:hypothetical protein
MTDRSRAKKVKGLTDLNEIQNVILPGFANTHAYPDGKAVEKALNDYYSSINGPAPTTLQTATKTSNSSRGGKTP